MASYVNYIYYLSRSMKVTHFMGCHFYPGLLVASYVSCILYLSSSQKVAYFMSCHSNPGLLVASYVARQVGIHKLHCGGLLFASSN